MSDFALRIRDARTATKPADAAAPHPQLASAPPAPSLADARPMLAELEAQRRRVAELTRKIDELNAAILAEILRHPEGVSGYPRTVAALARKRSLRNHPPD
jgi:hypothetical protein